MISPFDLWTTMWINWSAMARTGIQMAETLQASQQVIDRRTRKMADATRDPWRGDYGELGRMVPEKMSAFSKAGLSAFDDMQAIGSAAIANWQQMMGLMLDQRGISMTDMATMSKRATGMAERAGAAPGKALKPIHSTATGNARRLSRKS